MSKFALPDALKAEVPQTLWGKILVATPVVMTVLATALAGLSSSEMTRAQYSRSYAAQLQSKAGDQWGFFQAKRLRGALQRSSLEMLRSIADVRPLDAAVLRKAGIAADSPPGRLTLAALQKGEVPQVDVSLPIDQNMKAAMDAVADQKPDTQIAAQLDRVSDQALAEALHKAQDASRGLDAALDPINRDIDQLEKFVAGADKALNRDFTAAKLRYTTTRYDAEARLNQAIANLYELQVHKSNLDAERHHKRSQMFFFGMLCAQAAVIIATFSLAAQKRSILWSLAAAVGASAVFFACYVYLFM
ncbi:MAG TPA: DUF4337 family protein [Nitrospirota bacterium]|nr:DUF4337 family protein [Nitrospirota bacterium]